MNKRSDEVTKLLMEDVLNHKLEDQILIFGSDSDTMFVSSVKDFIKLIEKVESVDMFEGKFSYPCFIEGKWIDTDTKDTRIKGILKKYGKFELTEIWCLNMCDECRERSKLITCQLIS